MPNVSGLWESRCGWESSRQAYGQSNGSRKEEKMARLERLDPLGEWPEPVKKLQKEVGNIEESRITEEEANEREHKKFLNEHGIFSACYEKKKSSLKKRKRPSRTSSRAAAGLRLHACRTLDCLPPKGSGPGNLAPRSVGAGSKPESTIGAASVISCFG
jgi:hypothetical protein